MTKLEDIARAMQIRSTQPIGQLSDFARVECTSLGVAWEYLARAAVEAMREPTNKMRMAMLQVWELPMPPDYDASDMTPNWQAAIDAILNEKTE